MGTDIHLYVERRENGRWVSADVWEADEDYPDQRRVPYRRHYYSDRNYDLFAILADVRNGKGFAGCDTGDGFVPIAMPRGFPDDMSPEMQREAERVEHTPSWLTLAELLAYDWTQTTTLRGWVNGPQFYEWDRWSRGAGHGPKAYCGGISGLNIVHVTDEELQRQVNLLAKRYEDHREREKVISAQLSNVYAQVSWQTPYYRAAGNFLSEAIPRLLRLGKPEDVRIIFYFDS